MINYVGSNQLNQSIMAINLNNKHQLQQLDNEILDALKGIMQKYDITFSPAGGTMGITDATVRLRITNNNLSEAAKRSVIADFEMYDIAKYFNKTVRTHDGQLFKVTSINHSARKNPVVLVRPDGGNGAKCPVSYLKNRCTIID